RRCEGEQYLRTQDAPIETIGCARVQVLKKTDGGTERHAREQYTLKQVRASIDCCKSDETSHAVGYHLNPGASAFPPDLFQKDNESIGAFQVVSPPIICKGMKRKSGRRSPVQKRRIDIVPGHTGEWHRGDQSITLLSVSLPFERKAQGGCGQAQRLP